MSTSAIRFSRNDSADFFKILNRRVNAYFKDNELSKTGNVKLHVKAVAMFALFLVPYFLILLTDLSDGWKLLFAMTMGLGMAGIGMNVMHDGNHGSYSRKKWVNKFMGGTIYVVAGNVYNWQVQHNVLHHNYTNIHGHDEDLETGAVMRFSKHAEWKRIHKYQHLYS